MTKFTSRRTAWRAVRLLMQLVRDASVCACVARSVLVLYGSQTGAAKSIAEVRLQPAVLAVDRLALTCGYCCRACISKRQSTAW